MKRRTALKMVAVSALTPTIPTLMADKSPSETKRTSNTRDDQSNTDVLASIRLYNPTRWTHQTLVEVPVGELAAPGLIDWRKVRLVCDGQDVPFSLREGRVHWRASLAPVTDPRAEDLMVFTLAVPQGAWTHIDLVSGRREKKTALSREGARLVVSYPNLKVVIDEITGMLVQVEAFGEGLLAMPISAEFFHVEEGVIEHSDLSLLSYSFLSYSHPSARVKRERTGAAPHARLVSSFSEAALTELNFLLESEKGPGMALTYRVLPGGPIEIWADERPWEGPSPWLNYGVEYKLSLRGEEERLPHFETQFPFFGFKDYGSAVKNIGILHRGKGVATLEIGEASINGRRWNRRLYIAGGDQLAHLGEMIELVDEGLVMDAAPVSLGLEAQPLQIFYPDGCQVIAERLVQALRRAGWQAESSSGAEEDGRAAMVLKIVERPEAVGLEGDGFAIQPRQGGNGASIMAGTRFGLMMGTLKVAEQARRTADTASIPLIASNPAVDLRAGGFGGDPHEVDFPYGSDDEWTKVFDNLIASGMNVMGCLGLWGNWKMPLTFKYMPELRFDSPDAYDEVSGAKFSEFSSVRDRALKFLNYLHDRGVRVWLWVPVGAIPTTFAEKFPEALLPEKPHEGATFRGRPIRVPLVMHPKYRQYLQAFFKELLETYPLDGLVLVRDDNGGIDTSEDFKKYLATSRTKDPMWEQYLMIYEMLRSSGFRGDLGVQPYFDLYEPHFESTLPKDLFIVGHGSGFGTLTRHYKVLGPMGDTWLDNLYASFRLPAASRMKRLLADRGSCWIGGAFHGTELPWEAIGYFGWEVADTVNTLRYDWGGRAFGKKNALSFLRFNSVYEQLWNLMNGPLLPYNWLGMSPPEKKQVEEEGREGLELYQKRLAELLSRAGNEDNKDWFAQVKLYGAFFEYCMRRLELFGQLYEIVLSHKDTLEASNPLPSDIRRRVISLYGEMLESAEPYAKEIKTVPGGMMRATEPFAHPYKETMVSGYGEPLDKMLKVPEFAGTLTVSQQELRAGRPFTLTIVLYNGGICPWLPSEGHKLELDAGAKRLGLPLSWDLTGEWVLPGDRREVNLPGTAPEEPGTARVRMKFWSPSGEQAFAFIDHELLLKWE